MGRGRGCPHAGASGGHPHAPPLRTGRYRPTAANLYRHCAADTGGCGAYGVFRSSLLGGPPCQALWSPGGHDPH
eukprot:2941385-Alexandrium_andersonii.AAC.1